MFADILDYFFPRYALVWFVPVRITMKAQDNHPFMVLGDDGQKAPEHWTTVAIRHPGLIHSPDDLPPEIDLAQVKPGAKVINGDLHKEIVRLDRALTRTIMMGKYAWILAEEDGDWTSRGILAGITRNKNAADRWLQTGKLGTVTPVHPIPEECLI